MDFWAFTDSLNRHQERSNGEVDHHDDDADEAEEAKDAPPETSVEAGDEGEAEGEKKAEPEEAAEKSAAVIDDDDSKWKTDAEYFENLDPEDLVRFRTLIGVRTIRP
jgi:ribonuclease E